MASPITDEIEVIRRHRLTQIIRRFAWIHFKLAIASWALAFMFLPPTTTQDSIGNYIWLGVCFIGALSSALGLTLGFRSKWRTSSVVIELAGLSAMLVGPVIYFSAQLFLVIQGTDETFQQRFALLFFAWAMVAAVLARMATVIPRFHREKRIIVSREN